MSNKDIATYLSAGTKVNFDSHITKVTAYQESGTLVGEITTSGDHISQGTGNYNYVVELEEGYVIDTVTVQDGYSSEMASEINNVVNNSFTYDDSGVYTIITITSKKSSGGGVLVC